MSSQADSSARQASGSAVKGSEEGQSGVRDGSERRDNGLARSDTGTMTAIAENDDPSKKNGQTSKATSCNECRRLKLKCSKVPWPCTMCVKRKLAHLCPDGTAKREKAKQAQLPQSQPQRKYGSASMAPDMFGAEDPQSSQIGVSAVWSRLSDVEQKLDLLLADRGLALSNSRASTSGLHDLANVASDYSRLSGREDGAQDSASLPARQHGLLALHADGRSTYVGPSAHSVYLAAEENDLQSTSHPASPSAAAASRPGSPTPVDLDSIGAAATTTQPQSKIEGGTESFSMDKLTPSVSDSQASVMTWATPGFRSPHSSMAIWSLLRPMLPSEDVAKRLVNVYFASVTFMEDMITRQEFNDEVWLVFYPTHGTTPTNAPPDGFNAFKMALLFSVLALGVLFDVKRPQRDPVGRALYSCGWNAMSLANFTESSSLEALIALIHLALYLGWRRAGRYSESAWPLYGVMTSMMTRIGLHRDPGFFNLSESEREKRRRLFWNLHNVEVLRCLSICRPSGIRERHVDVHFPKEWTMKDQDDQRDEAESLQVQRNAFQTGKCLLTRLINNILDDCLCAKSSYSMTMQYDARIQKLLDSYPAWMKPSIRTFANRSTHGAEEMERVYADADACDRMLQTLRAHLTYLNTYQTRLLLHRGWFSEALQQMGDRQNGHAGTPARFGASVRAVNESASQMIRLMSSAYSHYPALVLRWMFFWNALFSAAVCRSLFAIKKRSGPEQEAARSDLDLAISVLRIACPEWKPLEKPLGILVRMHERVQSAIAESQEESGGDAYGTSADPDLSSSHGSAQHSDDMKLIGSSDNPRTRRPSSTPKRSGKRVRIDASAADDKSANGPSSVFSASSAGAHSLDGQALSYRSDGSASTDPAMDAFPLFSPSEDFTMPASLPTFLLGGESASASGGGANTGGVFMANGQDDFITLSAALSGATAPSSTLPSDMMAQGVEGSSATAAAASTNASQLIQMLSAGVGWDDASTWDNAIEMYF